MFERKNLPILELKQRYEAGESLASLAVTYACHQQTIGTRLREAGVTIRSRRNYKAVKCKPSMITRMRELRAQGVKYAAIAMELGCAASTVYMHLAPYRNEHRAVLVEMLELLQTQLRRHLDALQDPDVPQHIKGHYVPKIKKLEQRIAALESVI